MHSPSEIRYRFGPLERRGLIGSLGPGQLLILAAAVLLTIVLVQALKSGAGLGLGLVVLTGGGLASFVPYQGRTLNEWVPVLASFFGRRLSGRHNHRSPAPEAGTRFRGGDVPVSLPDSIGKVELLAFPFRGVELGVIADRSAGTYTATIQARARSFVLLDPADKASRLAGWAGVVAGLAREGSPVSRVQWIERTVPDDRNSLTRYVRDAIDPSIGLDAAPLQSYLRLTQAASPVTEQHELYVVVQVSASKASRAIKQAGGRDTGACVVLARELETFARRLEGAEIEVLHALGPRRLAATIRLAFDPHSRPGLARLGTLDPSREEGVSARNAWPRQTETRWSYYRTNDVVHSTYWIAEWPRLQAAYPFISEGGLGSRGVYIGRDVFGGSFCYDPWELYGREITGPNMLVIGQIGYAKSSLVKTYIWRQMIFGRTAWIIDPKGEYDKLAEVCGVTPIRFVSGGHIRLNPLDPMIGGEAQLALLRSIAAVMLGRSLRPEEDACLERAHDEAVIEAARRGAQPTVPQVVARLLEPSDAAAQELRTSTTRMAEEGRQLALSLRRMGAGDLRGMFDGPTSRGLNLAGRLVVFNLREVKDEARPILMACTAAWLQGSWARDDGIRRIVVLDEAWVVLRHLAIARWLRESWKLARQYGVQNIAVMHRLSDLTAAGDAGSEQVQLAKGLLEDSETRVIYRQSPGEVEQARELLGLTQTECDQIPSLERGEALWRVGRRSFIV